jgi:hypothetical protein
LDDSDPTKPSEDAVCLMVSQYLYGPNEDIIANSDISGIGVRRAIYIQTFLNQIIASNRHTKEEALLVNAANAVALSAIAFATAGILRPDWPHLIIIYQYFLLISFSGISYNTIRDELRASEEFGPLIERLAVIDLYVSPLFCIVALSLWVGLFLAQHRMPYFVSGLRCTFGKWEVFGQLVDLQSSTATIIGLTTGAFFTFWFTISIFINTYARYKSMLKAKAAIKARYGPGLPIAQRPLPVGCDVHVVGDYFSAAIWKMSGLLFPVFLPKVWRWQFTITFRHVIILLRFGFWLYLVTETERMITINNLTDEKAFTYGQVSALILLVVPVSGVWKILYRTFKWFKNLFDSYTGHYQLLYGFGTIMGLIQITAIWSLLDSVLFKILFSLLGSVVWGMIEAAWSSCSMTFDQLLGNDRYPPASSFWQVWFWHHEIKIPLCNSRADVDVDQATELQQLPRVSEELQRIDEANTVNPAGLVIAEHLSDDMSTSVDREGRASAARLRLTATERFSAHPSRSFTWPQD